MVRVIIKSTFLLAAIFWQSHAYGQYHAYINDRLNHYITDVPSHKVFLHVDKDLYAAGETIWFKAYLFDGTTHEPVADSTNVYVELVDVRGNLLRKKVLASVDGVAWSEFALTDSMPDGNYQLRAYTGLMKHFGDNYFFVRQVYVSNPSYENYIRFREVVTNKLFNRRLQRMDRRHTISFYPEGGQLVAGLPARLAFRACNELGEGVAVSGQVLNSKRKPVAILQDSLHGMGMVSFTPADTKGYRARVTFQGKRKQHRIALPPVRNDGMTFRVDQVGDSLHIQLLVAGDSTAQVLASSSVVGHIRGSLIYTEKIALNGNRFSRNIPVPQGNPGIAEFVVLSMHDRVLASRMVYVASKPEVMLEVRDVALQEDGVHVSLMLLRDYGYAADGHYSAVVRALPDHADSLSAADHQDHSLAHLPDYILKLADLPRGMHTNIMGYQEDTAYVDGSHELFMLTRSWHRFDLGDVVNQDYVPAETDIRPGVHISGTVINPGNDKPLPRHNVSLTLFDKPVTTYRTQTNDNGYFSFSGLSFSGIRTAEVIADVLPAGYFPRLRFDVGQHEPSPFHMNYQTRQQSITRKGPQWKKIKMPREAAYRIPEFYTPLPNLFGNPSQTIFVTQSDDEYKRMIDLLIQRGTGLYVQNGQVVIRGASSMVMSNEPMFMIDGLRVDRNTFLALRVMEVHKVEIYKGANTAIFGVSGGNGVIMAFTRRGGMYGRDGYEFDMAGFAVPATFSSSAHTRSSRLPLHQPTVYWSPDIVPDEDGMAGIVFMPIAGRSTYLVHVQGMDGFGRMLSESFRIQLNQP